MRYVQCWCWMTARNERHHTKIPLSDFNAVSFYPSAMRHPWTVLGTPQVIPQDHIILYFILDHSFTENQTESAVDQFISSDVVEIEVTSTGIKRDFPLIQVQ